MSHKTKALSDAQRVAFLRYCQWAGLSDHERHVLTFQTTGLQSVARACLGWTDHLYDRLMCAIEGELEAAVAAGTVNEPLTWKDPTYWRRKTGAGGEYINSRQRVQIRELWDSLLPLLPADRQDKRYLGGIVARACGQQVPGLDQLTAGQAGLVIDALKRKIAQQARQGKAA